jgi:hypothetical protein
MKQFQKVSKVMVWDAAISKKGKLLLLSIEEGVKINQDYIEHVLENHLFEHAKNLHVDYFCAQLNFALFQTAKRTQKTIYLIFFRGKKIKLACIVNGSQPIRLFCLGIYFVQNRLHVIYLK